MSEHTDTEFSLNKESLRYAMGIYITYVYGFWCFSRNG